MRTAWHEAGHAVVSAACCFSVTSVSIDLSAHPPGNAKHRLLTDGEQQAYADGDKDLLTSLALICMAGEASEMLFYEHNGLAGMSPVGGKADREVAELLIGRLGRPKAELSLFVDAATVVLARRLRVVEFVGNALAVRHALQGREVALESEEIALLNDPEMWLSQEERTLISQILLPE